MTSWRDRATPRASSPMLPSVAQEPYVDDIGVVDMAAQQQVTQPQFAETAPQTVQPEPAQSSWRSRATPRQTQEQPAQPQERTWGQAMMGDEQNAGILRTALDSGLQGTTFGFADEITDRLGAGAASLLTGEKYSDLYNQARDMTYDKQAQQFEQRPALSIGSNVLGSLGTGGAFAATKAGQSLANSLRGGNALTQIAKGAGTGAASGAVYGAGAAKDGERVPGAIGGGLVGGAVGTAIPAIARAGSGLKSTIQPKISETTAALAKRARDFGIPLRLDQVSPTRVRSTVQKVSQEIPGSGVEAFEVTQRKAFASAVARTIGQDAEDLGPSVIQGFRQEISKKFDRAIGGQTIEITQDTPQLIAGIVNEAANTIDDALVKVVQNNADDLIAQIQSGTIQGEKLSSIRSQLLKRSTKAKNEAGQFLNDLIDVIDNNIDQNLSPDKLAELSQARSQWRNFKTIQPLLNKSTDGTINPTELVNRVSANKFIDASKIQTGQDDLVDLARIGKELIKIKGGSDTYQKAALAGGGTALGITALTNPLAALVPAAVAGGTALANRGLQSLNSSQKLVDKVIRNASKAPVNQLAKPAANLALRNGANNTAVAQHSRPPLRVGPVKPLKKNVIPDDYK
jgi:hypothetical protein